MLRQDSKPELIFYNGKILTVDENFSIQQAIAIQADKIQAVGTNDEVLALSGDNTTRIDLQGRTVIPGFNDSHHHFLNRAARAYYGVRLDRSKRRNLISMCPVARFPSLICVINDFKTNYKDCI